MMIREISENLRRELLRRIAQGTLTRTALARESGFRQSHISNYLNGKRSLSIEGIDRVLVTAGIAAEDLFPIDSMAASASDAAPAQIPVVPAAALSDARIRNHNVRSIMTLPAEALSTLPEKKLPERELWQRFVAFQFEAGDSRAMDPVVRPGAVMVIDRYDTAPAEPNSRQLYAALAESKVLIRYLQLSERGLLLCPHNPGFEVAVFPGITARTISEVVLGRVCWMQVAL